MPAHPAPMTIASYCQCYFLFFSVGVGAEREDENDEMKNGMGGWEWGEEDERGTHDGIVDGRRSDSGRRGSNRRRIVVHR
jgi:hypothetical protein